MSSPIIAIDPGANGGIAWLFPTIGCVRCAPMPDTMTGVLDLLRDLRGTGMIDAVVENVGGYVPGNSGPSAATFARHCGHIDAATYCLGYSTRLVTAAKWQAIVPGLPKGTEAKTERKRMIRDAMGRRYPHLKVTLKTADALGILTWAMERT